MNDHSNIHLHLSLLLFVYAEIKMGGGALWIHQLTYIWVDMYECFTVLVLIFFFCLPSYLPTTKLCFAYVKGAMLHNLYPVGAIP